MSGQGRKSAEALSEAFDLGNANWLALDTSPLIYYFEDRPPRSRKLEPVFEDIRHKRRTAVVSIMTVHEILIKPKRLQDPFLISGYKESLLDSGLFEVHEVNREIAEIGADLRARYQFLGGPDAIIIATALAAKVDLLITSDRFLKRIQELPVLVI